MPMTPIHRIPMELDSPPLHEIVRGELDSIPQDRDIAYEMTSVIDHDPENDSLSVMMDWAMQIRDTFGYSWGDCIHAASILYYG